MDIIYSNRIELEEYNALRDAVGFRAIERRLAENGLANSAFLVCARDGAKAVGMARVVTDYGYFVYISDVMVFPEYQGKGIGGEIMKRVMAYINGNIEDGQSKLITLMAAKGKEGFYEKLGLIKRPNDIWGCGMSVWLEKKEDQNES